MSGLEDTAPLEEDLMARRRYYRQRMKTFNITKKYFKYIYAYVWCEICNDIIAVQIDKDEIRNGLQTGLYISKHPHTNDNKDEENPQRSQRSRTYSLNLY